MNRTRQGAPAPRLVDLSLTVSTGMPTHAAFPPPVIVPYSDHETTRELNLGTPEDPHTAAVNYITMLDHTGTHVDAPLHASPAGSAIDELPLSTFTGPAVRPTSGTFRISATSTCKIWNWRRSLPG